MEAERMTRIYQRLDGTFDIITTTSDHSRFIDAVRGFRTREEAENFLKKLSGAKAINKKAESQ